MLPLRTPLRFDPFLRPMVWGGRALARLGKPLPGAESYGESWEVSDHPSHRSVVAEGEHAGRLLRQLVEMQGASLLGGASQQYDAFPWLIKFLDAADWLSVQVHPDERTVAQLWPGEGSKTEAWFILDAQPGSRIYAGLKPGVGRDELRRGIEQGHVAECLHSFVPRAGDCVYLPAGTVHALGGGVLLAEVQQTSDATFRLFDWNRRDAHGNTRKLHIDEGFAAIDWQQGPVAPVSVDPAATRQTLVQSSYFTLEFIRTDKPFTAGNTDKLQALIALTGHGQWSSGETVAIGQTWILPAELSSTTLTPQQEMTFLLCTLP